MTPNQTIEEHDGKKYLRKVHSAIHPNEFVLVDIYEIILAYAVACPARQHAIKKLLCAGLRNKGSELQDLLEAQMSLSRAIEIQQRKET